MDQQDCVFFTNYIQIHGCRRGTGGRLGLARNMVWHSKDMNQERENGVKVCVRENYDYD